MVGEARTLAKVGYIGFCTMLILVGFLLTLTIVGTFIGIPLIIVGVMILTRVPPRYIACPICGYQADYMLLRSARTCPIGHHRLVIQGNQVVSV